MPDLRLALLSPRLCVSTVLSDSDAEGVRSLRPPTALWSTHQRTAPVPENAAPRQLRRVVIIGAGFGGLMAVMDLRGADADPQHGDEAEIEAAQKADLMLSRADRDGELLWLRIKRELQAPGHGTAHWTLVQALAVRVQLIVQTGGSRNRAKN